jgi:hypothetical protein
LTVFSQVLEQPFFATVSVSLNDPVAPAVTYTESSVAEPLIVPLPVIDQLKLELASVLVPTYRLFVEPAHTLGPLIEQVGTGFTVTVFSHVLGQLLLVTVSVKVNEPGFPAVTRTESTLVEPTIEPLPAMDQA